MHNLKEIRKDYSKFEKDLEKRSVKIDFNNLKKLDELFVLDIDASRKANDIDKNLRGPSWAPAKIVDNLFKEKERRKYVVVIIFAAAALLTPPDPITQIGLAVPLLILYELSIFSVKFIENKKLEKTDA